MAQYGYSIKDINETRAHACMRDVPMSYKIAVLIGKRIKGMATEKALRFLADVQTQKQAVPYRSFNDSVGHRPGIGPGRYPTKAAKYFEMLVKNAVANAEDKGLGKDIWVEFVVSQRAGQPMRTGSSRRSSTFKRSHVEIIVTNAPSPNRVRSPKKKK